MLCRNAPKSSIKRLTISTKVEMLTGVHLWYQIISSSTRCLAWTWLYYILSTALLFQDFQRDAFLKRIIEGLVTPTQLVTFIRCYVYSNNRASADSGVISRFKTGSRYLVCTGSSALRWYWRCSTCWELKLQMFLALHLLVIWLKNTILLHETAIWWLIRIINPCIIRHGFPRWKTGFLNVGLDAKKIARQATESYLIQILKHGFFHADPHPGNIAIGLLAYEVFGFLPMHFLCYVYMTACQWQLHRTHANVFLVSIVLQASMQHKKLHAV